MILRAVICEVVIYEVDKVELEDLNLAFNAFTLILKSVLIVVIALISYASYTRIIMLSESNNCLAIFWPLIFLAII